MRSCTISPTIFQDLNFNSYNLLRNSSSVADNRNNDTDTVRLKHLLEVYSFGCISDYYEHVDVLGELSNPQLLKLRQLTLMTLASEMSVIPFTVLLQELRLNSTELLPTLLQLTSTSQQLVTLKIDLLSQTITIKSVRSREVYIPSQDSPLELISIKNNSIDDIIQFLINFRDEKISKVLDKMAIFDQLETPWELNKKKNHDKTRESLCRDKKSNVANPINNSNYESDDIDEMTIEPSETFEQVPVTGSSSGSYGVVSLSISDPGNTVTDSGEGQQEAQGRNDDEIPPKSASIGTKRRLEM